MNKKTVLLFFTFFIGLSHLTKAQNLDWAFQLGNIGEEDYVKDAITDTMDNVYMVGYYLADMDVDPGPDVYTLTSPDITVGYITKYNTSGELVWAKQIDGDGVVCTNIILDTTGFIYVSGYFFTKIDINTEAGVEYIYGDDVYSSLFIFKFDLDGNKIWSYVISGDAAIRPQAGMELTADNNIYIAGFNDGNIDLDAGPGVYMLNNDGVRNQFLMLISNEGNFVSVIEGGEEEFSIVDFDIDSNNDFIITGTFSEAVDFDPGPLEAWHTAAGGADVFIAKWNAAGVFQWASFIGGTAAENVSQIELGNENVIYLTGNFNESCDFDPGLGTQFLTSAGYSDAFLSKYDADGNYLWAFQLGGIYSEIYQNIILDKDENILLTGDFRMVSDFDPGPGVYNMSASSSADIYFAKYTTNGEFISANKIYCYEYGYAHGIALTKNNDFYIAGRFSGKSDFDLNADVEFYLTAGVSPTYKTDIFLVKYNQDPCSNMGIITDSITNLTCSNFGLGSVHVINGAAPYTYEWNTIPVTNDSIAIFENSGIYTVSVTDTNSCVRTTTYVIDGPETAELDMEVNVISEEFRPGFYSNIWVNAYNNGCNPADGALSVVLSSYVEYLGASPLPDIIIGDTLKWYYNDFVYGMPQLQVQIFVNTVPEVIFGLNICHFVGVTNSPLDINLANNNLDFCSVVVGAFDPNDKSVSPKGACEQGLILNNQELTYTIRFQNTGNADAINIEVIDTICNQLNMNTFEVVNSSHFMFTEVMNDTIIKFVFPNIHLPDSSTNEAESHGYVVFKITPKPDLPIGTEIKNNVGIYFDFNEPVITNTTLNTITDVIPEFVFYDAYNLCMGDSITIGENTYFENGVYTNHFISAEGCDSTLISTILFQSINNSLVINESNITAMQEDAEYQWVICDGTFTAIAGATNQSYTPVESGNYAVIITLGACVDTSECRGMIVGEVLQTNDNKISIYPNPAHDYIFIKANNEQITNIRISNMQQQYVLQIEGNGKPEQELAIHQLAIGMYIIEVITQHGIYLQQFNKH